MKPKTTSTAPVIHGSVSPDGAFFFWGENPAGPGAKRRGRRPKISHHPFALPAASLKEILNSSLPGPVPIIEETRTVWLPTSGQAPEPSPEIRARAGLVREKSTVVLQAWEIPVCRIPVSSVVPFLISGESRREDYQ